MMVSFGSWYNRRYNKSEKWPRRIREPKVSRSDNPSIPWIPFWEHSQSKASGWKPFELYLCTHMFRDTLHFSLTFGNVRHVSYQNFTNVRLGRWLTTFITFFYTLYLLEEIKKPRAIIVEEARTDLKLQLKQVKPSQTKECIQPIC